MNIFKTAAFAIGLSLFSGAALAADDCCCKEKDAKMACCDKMKDKAPAKPGEAVKPATPDQHKDHKP
jgi:hypothetical protein